MEFVLTLQNIVYLHYIVLIGKQRRNSWWPDGTKRETGGLMETKRKRAKRATGKKVSGPQAATSVFKGKKKSQLGARHCDWAVYRSVGWRSGLPSHLGLSGRK